MPKGEVLCYLLCVTFIEATYVSWGLAICKTKKDIF